MRIFVPRSTQLLLAAVAAPLLPAQALRSLGGVVLFNVSLIGGYLLTC